MAVRKACQSMGSGVARVAVRFGREIRWVVEDGVSGGGVRKMAQVQVRTVYTPCTRVQIDL